MTARMKLSINLPADVLQQMDKTRGDIPRSMFIQRSVEKYLVSCNGGINRRKR